MNNSFDGRNQRPQHRNPGNPAARRPVKQASAPIRKPAAAGKIPSRKPHQQTAKKQSNIIKVFLLLAVVLLFALVLAGVFMFLRDESELLNREVTIEAGSVSPDLNMYFKETPAFPGLVSCNLNFDEVNTDIPQTVSFNIGMYGRNYACKLIILDTAAPEGEGVPQKMFTSEDLPEALSCVTGIKDATEVAVSWKDVPDMSTGGNFVARALLTDACGNETVVDVPFEVIKDSNAPVISGAKNIEAYIGDPVAYRDKITVTDDYDASPELEIDTSAVVPDKEGTYGVVYTARDFSGNESSITVDLVLSEKPEGYVEPEVVYEAAREILNEITEPGMTDEEVALQIVWWCRYNIRFLLKTEYNSWTEAAYSAYQYRSGNCYATAYAVKALLDVAGFENSIIERWPYETATHFWNYVLINGQWYHCDATWREGYDSYFFMYTTEELHDFWQGGWNGFQYRVNEYPESATESVQDRIDYKNHTIKAA